MSSFQTWLVEVGAKKMVPSLVRAALAGLVGLIAAHQGLLTGLGIVYDPTGGTVVVHLGALRDWLDAGSLGVVASVLAALQHHATAAVSGAPQSGAPKAQA